MVTVRSSGRMRLEDWGASAAAGQELGEHVSMTIIFSSVYLSRSGWCSCWPARMRWKRKVPLVVLA